MESLVADLPTGSQHLALEDKSNGTGNLKRPAPSTGGCRVEGFVRVKKVISELKFILQY
jgi:hypothetical protein